MYSLQVLSAIALLSATAIHADMGKAVSKKEVYTPPKEGAMSGEMEGDKPDASQPASDGTMTPAAPTPPDQGQTSPTDSSGNGSMQPMTPAPSSD
jgi:hypothetical protein